MYCTYHTLVHHPILHKEVQLNVSYIERFKLDGPHPVWCIRSEIYRSNYPSVLNFSQPKLSKL